MNGLYGSLHHIPTIRRGEFTTNHVLNRSFTTIPGALKKMSMSSSGGHSSASSSSGYLSGVYVPTVNQGLPTLIVMMVVLAIIVLFCFWGAPAVRAFCRRKICCCCPMDEPNIDNVSTGDGSATPTIILLPYGRMLVVDRNVFAQLQADHTGIDFMELSANLIRAQRIQTGGSNPSILESEATSKGLSPTSIDFLPPAYEEIFGAKNCDLPPSYSEISMMLRKMSGEDDNIGTCGVNVEERIDMEINEKNVDDKKYVDNKNTLRTSSSAPGGGGGYEFTPELNAYAAREFSSLENNIERNNSAENLVEIVSAAARFNSNVIVHNSSDGEHDSGENFPGNCDSLPENVMRKNERRHNDNAAGYNSEPCNGVQYSQRSLNERRDNCNVINEANEFVDRESTV